MSPWSQCCTGTSTCGFGHLGWHSSAMSLRAHRPDHKHRHASTAYLSLQDAKAAPKLSAEEQEHLQMMPRFFLDNAHFYCETVDITYPFPSSHPVSKPSWEFVWNSWLAAGLRAVGLQEQCPNLLQVSRA